MKNAIDFNYQNGTDESEIVMFSSKSNIKKSKWGQFS